MKALIVDDLEMNREILAIFLEGYGTVAMAEDGEEAIRMVTDALGKGEHFDLICLDISMPGIDGHETLRRIRTLEAGHGDSQAKVFMVTASSSPDDMVDALVGGACDDYLIKPIVQRNFKELLARHGLTA